MPLTLDDAFTMLVHSYLLTASQRHMGSLRALGPARRVRYQPEGVGRAGWKDTLFVTDCPPRRGLAALRALRPLPRSTVFVVDPTGRREAAYRRLGFAPGESQWLMVRRLAERDADPDPRASPPSVRLARSPGEAVLLGGIAGVDPVAVDDLLDPLLAHYYVEVDGSPVALARSAAYDGDTVWVSHVHTAPALRSRGYASALMDRIHSDNAAAGRQHSVLLATAAAHGLYWRLGYRELAPVHVIETLLQK